MKRFSLFMALLTGMVFVVTAANATDLCGEVSGVLGLEGSPYVITCNLMVPAGYTLTIDAGVEILFSDNYKIDVLGSMFANGTEQDSIFFKPSPENTSHSWRGIRVGTDNSRCDLNYCVVEWAWKGDGNDYDSNGGGLISWYSTTHVDHCAFRYNTATRGSAVALYSGNSTISNTLFAHNNATYGGAVWVGDNNIISGCTFCTNVAPSNRATVYLGGSGLMTSCIIAFCHGYAVDFGGGGASARFCDFSENSSGVFTGQCPGGFTELTTTNARGDSCDPYQNIFLDPSFVDIENEDFRLLPESPCVDAGDPVLPQDPDGSVADIGAYDIFGARELSIESPNGGDVWRIDDFDTIRWSSIGVHSNLRIEVNPNYPTGVWETIAANTANDGEVLWLVNGPPSSHVRIRVMAIGDTTIVDESDSDFTVIATLNLSSPNGQEAWTVGQPYLVRWLGHGVQALRIELNRNFPDGPWEVISDSTANDIEESWIPTPPLAEHCRIRLRALGDTLTDISDADFSIGAAMQVIAPNGGEQWELSHADTVRWIVEGVDAVRIELTRDYPMGIWEPLVDSAANDGSEAVTISGIPSNACRIRVEALGHAGSDFSDMNFALVSSSGYLALVQRAQPQAAVDEWSAGISGNAVASPWFHLKNFGNTTIHISPPGEPPSAEFSRTAGCNTYFTLPAGQMSACSLRLIFDPVAEGIFHDTLRIQTDAANAVHDTVRIPLSGTMLSAPASPQITIRALESDIRLNWHPVTQTIHGYPVTVTFYLVFSSTTPQGHFEYLGYTTGTSYIDASAASYMVTRYYQVVAYIGGAELIESLPGNGQLTKGEVLSRLRGTIPHY